LLERPDPRFDPLQVAPLLRGFPAQACKLVALVGYRRVRD
jgi:hypothetical protein